MVDVKESLGMNRVMIEEPELCRLHGEIGNWNEVEFDNGDSDDEDD